MGHYIFETHSQDRELKRLKHIEEAFDDVSMALMKKTGIRPDDHCLEIGPGAGSLMKWMGEQVGTQGRVTGIDKNTKYIAHLNEAPYEVIEGDFSNHAPSGLFDHVHCRYVLIHNPEKKRMISKIRKALKPGAMLVLEEPDFTSAKLLNAPEDQARWRVNSAICKMFVDLGLHPGYGLTLPQKLEKEGFEVLEVCSNLHFASGMTPVAKVMGESASALRDQYIATGEVSSSDLDQYIKQTENLSVWSVYYSTISVLARNPVGPE